MVNNNLKKVLGCVMVILVLSLGLFLYVSNKVGKDIADYEGRYFHELQKKNAESPQHHEKIILAGTLAPLLDYNKADYNAAIASDKLVVLYFYANWCPLCVKEFPLMQEVFNELTTDKVVGFRVNYNDSDTDSNEIALARQFGVAYQHTKVFVKHGQRILKSPESWDEERYETEIQKNW
ncbi:redoxin domain-containing protein [Candidatus Azambacteria bacterium]|nr:redoxin domain-containing protein [Candidatus Azambacteria bacterium]